MSIDRLWRWLGVAGILLSLAGCTRGDGKVRVAFVSNNAEDFWTIAEKGTDQAAAELGVECQFRKPPNGTKEQQQQIVEDLVNTGVQGLAVSVNDAANAVDFFEKVNAKIPLITQDSDLPDPKARRCYIGTDNYRAGLAVGALVAQAAPKGGKIAIFVGKLDVQNARERRQGVLDYLSDPKTERKEMAAMTPGDAAGLTVGNYVLVTTLTDNVSGPTCYERAQELLLTNPDLVCLIGLWAYNPPALLRAVHDSKGAKPVVVGFDEDYQTLDGIKAGACFGTVVQNPYEFGYQSVVILTGLARGKTDVLSQLKDSKTKQALTVDSEKRIFIPHRVITKDNVDEFYKELKQLKGK